MTKRTALRRLARLKETGEVKYHSGAWVLSGGGSEVASDSLLREVETMLDALRPSEKPLSKRGRKRTPELELARLARDYARLATKSPRPIIEVANKHGISQSQARARIYQARERGILQSVRVRGRAGGQLTQEAEELLRKAGRSQRKK